MKWIIAQTIVVLGAIGAMWQFVVKCFQKIKAPLLGKAVGPELMDSVAYWAMVEAGTNFVVIITSTILLLWLINKIKEATTEGN